LPDVTAKYIAQNVQYCFAVKMSKLLKASCTKSQKSILKSLLLAKIAFVLP